MDRNRLTHRHGDSQLRFEHPELLVARGVVTEVVQPDLSDRHDVVLRCQPGQRFEVRLAHMRRLMRVKADSGKDRRVAASDRQRLRVRIAVVAAEQHPADARFSRPPQHAAAIVVERRVLQVAMGIESEPHARAASAVVSILV